METRIPVTKPKADLEIVYTKSATVPEPCSTIRYRTKFGKIFEREECRSRGVVWYQVVMQ